jgi:hypothetical protein
VPEFRVAVAPCILARPALVLALSLDLLPDNGVVLCADKGVAPPVGWAKDLQQLGLDGIDVLQPRFQGALVLMPCPMMNFQACRGTLWTLVRARRPSAALPSSTL